MFQYSPNEAFEEKHKTYYCPGNKQVIKEEAPKEADEDTLQCQEQEDQF